MSTGHRRHARTAAVVALSVALAAGCGDGDAGTTTTAGPGTTASGGEVVIDSDFEGG